MPVALAWLGPVEQNRWLMHTLWGFLEVVMATCFLRRSGDRGPRKGINHRKLLCLSLPDHGGGEAVGSYFIREEISVHLHKVTEEQM